MVFGKGYPDGGKGKIGTNLVRFLEGDVREKEF